ncbi:MAG: SdrD B-like domain-containing protein, partial [Planctomycetota bacterium]
ISGTPTRARTSSFVLEVTDSGSAPQIARQTVTLTVQAPPATVAGQVFEDLDADGTRGSGEVGMDGWTVELIDRESGLAIDQTTTASQDVDGDGLIDAETERGLYAFAGIEPGKFDVRIVTPAGWTTSTRLADGRVFALRGLGSEMHIDEIDPTDGAVLNTFPAPQDTDFVGFQGLAVGDDRLFLVDDANFDGAATIWEINPNTGEVLDRDDVTGPSPALLMGAGTLDGKLFIQFTSTQLVVWDPAIDQIVGTVTTGASITGGITGADDLGVLLASTTAGDIITIDPATGAVLATYATGLGSLVGGLAYHNGLLLAAPLAGVPATAYVVDPADGSVLGSIDLGGYDPVHGSTDSVAGLAGDVTHIHCGIRRMALTWSDAIVGADFGVVSAASVTGQVFYDIASDGARNGGDVGMDGQLVELIDTATGEVIATAVTVSRDVDGSGAIDSATERGLYEFDGLLPGDVEVRVVLPAGYSQTLPAGNYSMTLAIGQQVADQDFGVSAGVALSTVSGQVFEDVDFDGAWGGGELGVNGRTLELVDAATGRVVGSAVTADSAGQPGHFIFDGVAPGAFDIRLISPTPWTQTAAAGTNVTVTGGQALSGALFGAGQMTWIAGQLFHDVDGSGALDGDDLGLDGRVVELVDSATDQWIDPATERGWYEFLVTAGDYDVRQVLPTDWLATTSAVYAVSLAYGQAATDLHFGSAEPCEITGNVYGERYADGDHWYYEDGVNGITVALVDPATGDVLAAAVTADEDLDDDGEIWAPLEAGRFRFETLTPGS